jgi:AAA+ ATPase superfamily predicted ATPase
MAPNAQPARLIDREHEITALRELAERRRPSLALLYGRRRVGKTFLLDRAWPECRVFYFLAAESTPELNRRDLLAELATWLGRPIDPSDYPSWRTVFRLLIGLSDDGPLVIVLDEFQYLLGGVDDAASQLVAVWDREVSGRPLTVVLCGSEISTLEGLLRGGRPLYGRFDWIHRLQPFDYFDASRMVADRTPRDAAYVYGVFGGMPSYLAALGPGESLGKSVTRTFLTQGGAVHLQLDGLVEQEKGIREPAAYRSVLAAIARGATEKNEIAAAAGLAAGPHKVRPVVERLEGLGLISRERNFGAPSNAPFRYRIADNAVRFWYSFLDPHRSRLETGEPGELWRHQVRPRLDTYMGPIFETVCRQAYVRHHARWMLPPATEWARWEGRDRNRRSIEIDIVARVADGGMLVGEVKWSARPADVGLHTQLLRDLEDLAASGQGWAHEAAAAADSARYIYFCAGGFTPGFRRTADAEGGRLVLLGLDDLYGAA